MSLKDRHAAVAWSVSSDAVTAASVLAAAAAAGPAAAAACLEQALALKEEALHQQYGELLQSQLLRLQFSDEALLVWSGNTVLRRFPYSEWLGWKLFWGPVPVLFYFREQRSIHLLPVLFDATALREQLNSHVSVQP